MSSRFEVHNLVDSPPGQDDEEPHSKVLRPIVEGVWDSFQLASGIALALVSVVSAFISHSQSSVGKSTSDESRNAH